MPDATVIFFNNSFVESSTRSRAGQAEESCFDSWQGQEILSSPKRPDQLWVLPVLLFQGVPAVLFQGLGRPCRERYQSPALVDRSRMSGTMSSLACACLVKREFYVQIALNLVIFVSYEPVAYSEILFGEGGGGFNKFSWRQRTERTGIWGSSTIVMGSGGSCNMVQEI